MNNRFKIGTLSLIASALLVGCGTSNTTNTNTDTISGTQETLSTGTFIDAAVEGAEYETTSGEKGKTNAKGEFQYKKGDKVKLHLGNLVLGEVTPQESGLVTPSMLTSGDENSTKLLLRTLQSLDTDGNTSNGIQIDQAVLETLKDIEETSMKEHDESTLLELDATLEEHLDDDGDGKIDVDEDEATEHYQDSIKSWNQERENDNNNDKDKDDAHGEEGMESNATALPAEIQSAIDMPASTLSQELADTLAYMGNEERLAYDVYNALYGKWGTKQFTNIATKSEVKHIQAVQALVQKYKESADINFTNVDKDELGYKDTSVEEMNAGTYDISKIQDLYTMLVEKGNTSEEDALKVGCMIEVIDVNDLNEYIDMAEKSNAEDIKTVFTFLRDGSYSHYWTFDKGLKKNGVSEGCCSVGTVDGVDYCQPEYPQKENEKGNGKGRK